jgi:hypothetical protein
MRLQLSGGEITIIALKASSISSTARRTTMAHFSIDIPNEFMQSLDEIVAQSGAQTRDLWVRNTIGNMLIQYQVQKDLAKPIKERTEELMSLWS